MQCRPGLLEALQKDRARHTRYFVLRGVGLRLCRPCLMIYSSRAVPMCDQQCRACMGLCQGKTQPYQPVTTFQTPSCYNSSLLDKGHKMSFVAQ
jgi:hypothetical protein